MDHLTFFFLLFIEGFVKPIPEAERFDLMSAYYRFLTGDDEEKKMECAKAWSTWEMITSKLYVSPDNVKKAEEDNVEYLKRCLTIVYLFYFLVCFVIC